MKSISSLLQEHKETFFVVLAIGSMFAIWVLFAIIVISLIYSDYAVMTLPNFGALGDSFNIFTSLFTGLAFAGVVISVVLQTQELKLQRKELKLQRKELKATRQELKEQKEQLKEQAKHLKEQQQEMANQSFDNKFFQMLNMFNTNVTNLKTPTNIKGKEVIKSLKDELITNIGASETLKTNNGDNPISSSDTLKNFNDEFKRFNGQDGNILKPYFISLYQILKYVDEKTPKKSILDFLNALKTKLKPKPKDYTNIIRAQLSSDELVLLLCNAIGVIPFSGTKYKKLLEKYAFFEHLDNEDITPFIDDVLKQYDVKVAGKNQALKEKIEELNKTTL